MTPPMGWNSWDCYGAAVTEKIVKQNADYIAKNMKKSGWEYVVVDIQWYEPNANNSVYSPFTELCMDEYGRLIPASTKFPSAADGKGFKPLADYVHGLGLKFGIHIMRGIPRQAVHQNIKIMNTDVLARKVAHPNNICPWNTDMYGVMPNVPGAQEYYDSILSLYAEWGVDFIKVDDISYTDFGKDTYAGRHEIEMIRSAINRCGRDIVLSLSCGPSPLEHAEHLAKYSNMWRITCDLWDRWEDIYDLFEKCRNWSPYSGQGHWPDADMLPLGHISIIGSEHGIGDRYTRLSRDEQITMMTLWSIARSPLMFGGECTDNDEFTLSILTNDDVLRVNQHGKGQHEVFKGGYCDQHVIWQSFDDETDDIYLAFFNIWNKDTQIEYDITSIGMNGTYTATELWSHESLGETAGRITVSLPIHGAKLIKFSTK